MDERIYGVYVTRDVLADKDAVPWCSSNDRTAIRAYFQALKQSPTPEDYVLIRLGYVCKDRDEYILIPDQAVIYDKNGQHVDEVSCDDVERSW